MELDHQYQWHEYLADHGGDGDVFARRVAEFTAWCDLQDPAMRNSLLLAWFHLSSTDSAMWANRGRRALNESVQHDPRA